MNTQQELELARIDAAIGPGSRLVVLGSTSFWGEDSQLICESAAENLAAASLVALTGGMTGVGQSFGRAFAKAQRAAGLDERLFHLLPHGFAPCDSGVTLFAGNNLYERREYLAQVGHAYLVIEGGPGTKHEADMAAERGVPIIPIARTGGYAGQLYAQMGCPENFSVAAWTMMADKTALINNVVDSVAQLLQTVFLMQD